MITNYKNITVLITGANGFIASHLTRKLVSLGADVRVFIEPDTSLWRIEDIKEKLSINYVDVTDFETVSKLIKDISPIKVFHLAGYVDASRSMDLIENMIKVNLLGTVNMLKGLIGQKYDCFINIGTCEEYGDNDAPFIETQRENPVSPYSASNVCSTYFCQMLHKIERMPIVTVRPFLTYGPGQVCDMLIPSLIKKCLISEEIEMTEGEQTREFNYVSDIVDGLIRAAINENAIGEIINLGNGIEYKIKEVADMIVKMTDTTITPEFGKLPYRTGEKMHFYSSNDKAKRLLEWSPKVSLEEGLKKTIEWYKTYLKNDTG